jgi:hypothetical protein
METCHETHCPKEGKKGAMAVNCCLNCPLCYVTVLDLGVATPKTQPATLEYPAYVSSYLYAYHASCWKPPNAGMQHV